MIRRLTFRRRDDGASAVEFALVVPILLVLVFGIIDYGIYFANSLAVRQAVREGARAGVVDTYNSFPSCGPATPVPSLSKLNCITVTNSGALAGTTYARSFVADATTGLATNQWVRGNYLVVCGVIESAGLTGLTPMPASGVVRSKVVMRIEQPATASSRPAAETGNPPGGWGFCVAQ